MSVAPITRGGFTLMPWEQTPESKVNYGATIEDLNLNEICDDDVQALGEAVWQHKIIVVKGQNDLPPLKQWELVVRFDPSATQVHSHGDLASFNKIGGLLSNSRDVLEIPGAENVRLIGKGYQGDDHFGIKGKTITKPLSHDWHEKDLPQDEFFKGHTRFQRWHIDAPMYDRDPAWFTTLRCFKRPSKVEGCPQITVHWDDGTGYTMTMEPGLTAFFSNVQAYELMTREEKQIADHSWVEYAPHPYAWIGNCKGNSNGLGLATQGLEKSLEQLGDYDPAKIKRYPMVWVNPITGERAFMVHGIVVRRMFLRSSLDETARVVDDVVEIRKFLKPLQERVLKPEYIVAPIVEPGDIVIWANYQVFHSAIDYPDAYGSRTMHQANIGASKGPVGPVPIPTL